MPEIAVADGPALVNGPLPPRVLHLAQTPAGNRDASLTYLSTEVADVDGHVSRVEVDWGDGTQYADAGVHRVRVTVTSVGCSGAGRQMDVADGEVRS